MINKRKNHYGVSLSVFRTKIWKELIGCCAIAAAISILVMLGLYGAMSIYISNHFANEKSKQAESEQIIAELQAYISQRALSISNVREIKQWEVKKGVSIYFTGTKESLAYMEDIQKMYKGTIIRVMDDLNEKKMYEVHFIDGIVVCYAESNKVERYYDFSFIVSVIMAVLLFVFILLQLVRKRFYYVIRLRNEIHALESGDLEHAVTVSGKDELAEIASGMNYMLRNIQNKISKEREAITANHELITAMSHDLRTPLTKQIGYLEILFRKKYSQPEELYDYIEKARNNAFIMKDTTDKLFRYFLAFGEQETGDAMCEVDGKSLFNTVLKEQIAYIISQGFAVSFQEITQDFRITMNPEEFARIFDNIFHNLRKYGDNSVPVNITHIFQQNVFLLMVQNGVKEDTSKVESTKIGLKIVEKIMKSMDGSVEVMNDGQYFIIQLEFKLSEE